MNKTHGKNGIPQLKAIPERRAAWLDLSFFLFFGILTYPLYSNGWISIFDVLLLTVAAVLVYVLSAIKAYQNNQNYNEQLVQIMLQQQYFSSNNKYSA